MKKSILLTLLILFIIKFDALAVDGTAVSVAWKHTHWNYTGDKTKITGNLLMRYDIKNNVTIKSDTIYKLHCWYPALSFDGKKVAFYAKDASGKFFIAMVNVDGTGLKYLTPIAEWGDAAHLDWPIGDWVYYEKPREGATDAAKGTGEIWKVNVNTPTLNEKIYDYTTKDDDKTWVRRFTMSSDAKRAGVQLRSNDADAGQYIHGFPAVGANPETLRLVPDEPGCNLGISSSGTYYGTYRWTAHTDLFLFFYDEVTKKPISKRSSWFPNLFDAKDWLGKETGSGAEVVRWSVNSDKWVIQCVGYHGHAGDLDFGSNPLIINFVDKQAIMPSSNPKLDACGLECYAKTVYLNNCTGDFWVSGIPADNVEKVDGTFLNIKTSSTQMMKASNQYQNPKSASINLQGKKIRQTYFSQRGSK